jgi:pimeloyl-ACP methyl ester carboxylesterase
MSTIKSEYVEMVKSLFSIPFIEDVKGNVHRPEFLYFDTRTGVPLLYLWDKGESKVLTPGVEPVMGEIALHDEKPWVAFAKDVGGTEDFAVYFLDYSTDEKYEITRGTIGRLTGLFWASDDVLVIGCDKKEYYVRVLNLDGTSRTVFTTDQQVVSSDYDYLRNVLIAAVGRGPGTKLAIITISTGDVKWVSESEASEDFFPKVYPEKGYLAYSTDVSGSTEIVIRSLETLTEIARAPVCGDIQFLPGMGNLEWINENTLFAAAAKDAQLSPRLLTISEGVWSDPLVSMSVLTSTRTSEGIVWTANSLCEPPCIQVFKEGKVTTLVQSLYTGEYMPGESHWYTSFDGRKIQGWLLKNPDPQAPLAVFCHGGPNFAILNMWRPDIQAVVQAGYHVFAPNFRGSTTFGSEFKNLNVGDIGGGDLKDVLYGAQYAAGVLGLKEKPAIVGGSYGGYATLQAVTTQPDAWAGGVALVPWVDLAASYELGDAHYRSLDIYLIGGTPEEKPELYRERSPVTHLSKLKSPVLVIAAENDSRCPLQPIEKFYEKAQELNLPVTLEIIREEGHAGGRIADMIRMFVLQLDFLKTLFD